MEEQKQGFDIKRSLITVVMVIAAACVVGGVTYYVLNSNFQKERVANEKALNAVTEQVKKLEEKDSSKDKTTASNTSSSASSTTSTTSPSANSVKGGLDNTYTNKECAFSLNYPDGFKVTNNGAQNAIQSSAEFFGVDRGFTAYCSGGSIDLVTNFIGEIRGSNNYRMVKNSDESFSYNIASNNGKLIIIKISDPNGLFSQANDILASLKRN